MLTQSMRVHMQISPDLTMCLPSLPHRSLRTKGKSLITKSHLKLSAPLVHCPVPPLTKKLLTLAVFWERETSLFSKRVALSLLIRVQGRPCAQEAGQHQANSSFLCAFVIVLWLGISVCLLIGLGRENTRRFIDMEGKIAGESWRKEYD